MTEIDLARVTLAKRIPERNGRPHIPLIERVTQFLSVKPDPLNSTVCWLWLTDRKPLTRRRAGYRRLRRKYSDGVLVNMYPENVRDSFAVPNFSREGKIDTLIRHLHREFIGEPPAEGRKSCGNSLCCNPWHWTAATNRTRAQLHAEAIANRPAPTIDPELDDDIEDLIEMMDAHWSREPTADFSELLHQFGSDYEPSQIAEAAILAVKRDCCPPAIRQAVTHAAHQALGD